MLNRAQRWIIFLLFCVLVLVCAALELFQIYSVYKQGFSTANAIWALIFGGLLVGCGNLFLRLFSKTFLKSGVTPERLHQFSAQRYSIIENSSRANEDIYLTRRNLITNTLMFSEECFKGWIPGRHFELCVFVDQREPLLFAYFDSNQATNALSMKDRERNPRFYIDKGYEVTRLLQTPTSQPHVIKNTLDPKANYVFTSNNQRKQLRSSILICLDVAKPCALVITSDRQRAFSEANSEVNSFIRFVCEVIHYDLVEGEFLTRIRELRPSLFS